MKKISEDAARAFFQRRDFKRTNTRVHTGTGSGMTILWLHNNPIATIISEYGRDTIKISHQGWETSVTQDRLNAILCRCSDYLMSRRGGKAHFVGRYKEEKIPFNKKWVDIRNIKRKITSIED